MATEDELKEYAARAFKPFDVVRMDDGCVGFISEVNLNRGQNGFQVCVSYSIKWIDQAAPHKTAWYTHNELDGLVIGNFMVAISEQMCHPFGSRSSAMFFSGFGG